MVSINNSRGWEVPTFKKSCNQAIRLLKSLQICLPRSARLKISISLNPRPPCFFGNPILFHEIQCIDLLPVPLLHQYSAKTLLISSQVPFGNLKTFIV